MKEPTGDTDRLGGWLSELKERQRMMRGAQAALESAGTAPVLPLRGAKTRQGMSLADLKPGECGYITRLLGSTRARLRLLEMGLTPGTHVQVTRAAAFGGPLDVNVRGYQLSLRRAEAAAVWLGDENDS